MLYTPDDYINIMAISNSTTNQNLVGMDYGVHVFPS